LTAPAPTTMEPALQIAEARNQLLAHEWPRAEINPNARAWTFAPIPLWLLQRHEVSFGAKCLYGRLVLYAGKNGVAFPNQVTLAAELGITARQVRRLIKELEGHKLIEAKKRGFQGPDRYVFLYHPWQELPPPTILGRACP